MTRTQWLLPALEVTLKAVCGSCNNGWMSALEGRARAIIEPLILGRPSRVGAMDQQVVATWLTKTALVLQHFYRSDCEFPPDHYRALRQTSMPLPDSEALIATYAANRHAVSNTSILRPAGYSSAGNVGAMAWRITAGKRLSAFGDELVPGKLQPYFVQIWPVRSDPCVWPLTLVLDDEALHAAVGGSTEAWSNAPP